MECVLSGPLGGDQQIGAMLVAGHIQALVFLRDPMTPQPHEPDINALVRACDVHNVPCATNLSTANMLLDSLAQRIPLDLLREPAEERAVVLLPRHQPTKLMQTGLAQ